MSGLQGKIADAVKARGYQIMTSPDKAYYWIQANVLKADKMDMRESQGWLSRGYEGAAVGLLLEVESQRTIPGRQVPLSVLDWLPV